MARMERRVQLWGWVTRRQASVATRTEEQVIALQRRNIPENKVSGWLFGSLAAGAEKADRTVPGPDGDIPVRVYRPASAPAQAVRPLIVYFHGGGFVFGDVRMGDWLCSTVAVSVGAVVVSVGYRLAPLHRFPAAVEDCYAAVAWAAAHAADLGATPGGPLGVMGESAGGTLSAVTCLLARDRGGPAISHQALIYPATDMTVVRTEVKSPFLSTDEMTAYRRLYLGPDGDPASPLASPLLAGSHAGLPPALIQVGEHDPLRDDGIRYAAALRDAGVPVRFTDYVGVPHGFINFPGLCRSAAQAAAEICGEQRAALVPANEPVK